MAQSVERQPIKSKSWVRIQLKQMTEAFVQRYMLLPCLIHAGYVTVENTQSTQSLGEDIKSLAAVALTYYTYKSCQCSINKNCDWSNLLHKESMGHFKEEQHDQM